MICPGPARRRRQSHDGDAVKAVQVEHMDQIDPGLKGTWLSTEPVESTSPFKVLVSDVVQPAALQRGARRRRAAAVDGSGAPRPRQRRMIEWLCVVYPGRATATCVIVCSVPERAAAADE